MALKLTTITATTALSLLLPGQKSLRAPLNQYRLAVFLLTLTAIIFRSEVAILLFCNITYIFLKRIARSGHLAVAVILLRSTVMPAGILGTVIGLCITIPVDSYFWQSSNYLWPELSAFMSNIIPPDNSLGASAWGTQPWHWYFTSALPRLVMNPLTYLVLWPIAIPISATSEPVLNLLLPNLAYIAIYSILPHKETRFIFPVIPPLTMAAALSASYIWTHRRRTLLYRLLSIALILSTFLSALIAHAVLLPLSALSYPGAHALNALHNEVSSVGNLGATKNHTHSTILVHLDNLSTQTGITRFLQHSPPSKLGDPHWLYNKFDDATDLLDPVWWTQFDYAIMESPRLAIGSWDVVSTIRGFGSVRILRPDEKRENVERVSHYGLDSVASQMYGRAGRWASVVARQSLREGYGTQWMLGRKWSWTRGWWFDAEWVPKLYVLKRHESLAREETRQNDSFNELR